MYKKIEGSTKMEAEVKGKGVVKEINEDEVKEAVRLKVGVIGCGNAGNQCVSALYKAGITENLFAINTSTKDLSDEVINHLIPSFIAGGQGRGSANNRDYAVSLFRENGMSLFTNANSAVYKIIHTCDITVVVFSTGGGSGSGIGPALCQILKGMYAEANKLVIAYGITPKISEGEVPHANNLAAINDCEKLQIPMLLDDLSKFEDMKLEKAYDLVAQNFIKYINSIRGEYSTYTKNGMIDENDTKRYLSEPKYQAHYHLEKLTAEMIEQESIQQRILKEIKVSPTMNIQKATSCGWIAVYANFPKAFGDGVSTGKYDELIEYVGVPKKIFLNNGVISGNVADVHVIISGLLLPYDQILRSKEIVDARKERERLTEETAAAIDLSAIAEAVTDSNNMKIANRNDITKSAEEAALSFFA